MLDTLGTEGLLGVGLIVFAIALLTWHDPIVGGGVMILVAGTALIARAVATSVMSLFGMR